MDTTLTIEIASETERVLQSEAQRKGLTPKQFVQNMLEEKLLIVQPKNGAMQVILHEMFSEGMISRIPEKITTDEDDFEPIKINGKPLSETILEDRN